MRLPIYTVVVPILAAAAFAQDPPPVQPKQPTESAAPSKAATSNQGQSDRASEPKSGTMPAPTSGAAGAQAPGKNGGQGSERLPEMKTETYSGTLMDASCAGSGSAATTSSSSASSTSSSPNSTATSSADRSAASASGNQGCTLSASTTQFALKMKDGKTVLFDDVGNVRAQEAMKTRKMWSDSAAASKPVRVKASGVLNGDKLTVLSVN